MKSATHFRWPRSFAFERSGGLFLFVVMFLWIHNFPALAQQSQSLGDIARQARTQKQTSESQAAPSKAQELADQLQQEQEETENAPVGFKTYNAGDYRLFVPFPYEIVGRDYFGAVLAGSRLGVTNTEVMVGNRIPMPSTNDEHSVSVFMNQFAARYGQYPNCNPFKLDDRKAFRCTTYSTQLLGRQVWGTMLFVVASNSLIPIVCVSPDEMNEHLVYGSSQATYQQKQAAYAQQSQRFRDELTTGQVCDKIIYPSVRLKEDYVSHSMTAATANDLNKPAKPAEAKGLAAIPSPSAPIVSAAHAPVQSATANGNGTPSLAEIAHRTKESSTQPKAKLTLDSSGDNWLAPAGMKSQSFYYCKGQGNCWNGSFFVPTNALLLNSDYSQYVFQVPLGNDNVLLYAGPAGVGGPGRNSNDPNLIRWEELNDPEGWVGRGRVQAITHDEATVAGRPAILTHFEFKKTTATLAGVRANVESHSVEVLVGCMVPKNRFAEADQVCSTLIDSLRLP